MVGVIFVCDECLDELKISRGDFDPFDISEMIDNCEEAKDWLIPDLAGYCKEEKRYFEIPTSSIISVCSKCKHLYEEIPND